MKTLPLKDKALILIERREAKSGFMFYWRQIIFKHLLFSAIFSLLIVAGWLADVPSASFVIAGLWAGRLIRDFQWIRVLNSEWGTLREFIDWEKVQLVVNSKESGPPPVN